MVEGGWLQWECGEKEKLKEGGEEHEEEKLLKERGGFAHGIKRTAGFHTRSNMWHRDMIDTSFKPSVLLLIILP
jgi:hypothetical protein